MAESNATQTPLDALSETYDVLIQGIRATNDRAHRLSTALIEDAKRGQRERLQLTKRLGRASARPRKLFIARRNSDTVTRSRIRVREPVGRRAGRGAERVRRAMLRSGGGNSSSSISIARRESLPTE